MDPKPRRVTLRSISLASLGLAFGVGVGCWTGVDSRGLPCASDSHCGLGLECIDGYCGGEPFEGLCGNGYVDPDELCDDGEQNADNGACRPDCTPAVCGDGFVGPGEDCDDGGESATCDVDCTAVVCGDGYVNPVVEDCDDGDNEDGRECMGNCSAPIFWDDMETDTPAVAWEHEKVSGDPAVTDTWSESTRETIGQRAWDSGLPAAAPGDTRLSTPEIDLGPYAGRSIELRFDHAREFTDCNDSMTAFEGAVVEVSIDGGQTYTIVEPTTGYTGQVGDDLCMDNPLFGEWAFTLDQDDFVRETFDLSEFAGEAVKIGFRVGWDCNNCGNVDQGGRGWFIDNVVVWRSG